MTSEHLPILAYGYTRDDTTIEVDPLDAWLRTYANRQGWDFGTVFHERGSHGSALAELLTEVRRAQAAVVVLMSFDDLCDLPQSRTVILNRFGRAGAAVCAVSALRPSADPTTEG